MKQARPSPSSQFLELQKEPDLGSAPPRHWQTLQSQVNHPSTRPYPHHIHEEVNMEYLAMLLWAPHLVELCTLSYLH